MCVADARTHTTLLHTHTPHAYESTRNVNLRRQPTYTHTLDVDARVSAMERRAHVVKRLHRPHTTDAEAVTALCGVCASWLVHTIEHTWLPVVTHTTHRCLNCMQHVYVYTPYRCTHTCSYVTCTGAHAPNVCAHSHDHT